jgi:hypothetical protein
MRYWSFTVLPYPVAFQRLETIIRQDAQVVERARAIQQPQPADCNSSDVRPPPRGLTVKQLLIATIAE